ncbi:MAG TPA: hypothetical protein VIW29_05035 [Polyangiaceae bacterium]
MPTRSNSTQDLTWDFVEFLAKRRERSSAAASHLIGDWLLSYQPGPIALSHVRKALKSTHEHRRVAELVPLALQNA